MARKYEIQLWKRAPFIRLLPPLVLGIGAGHYFQFPYPFLISAFSSTCILLFLFEKLPIRFRFIIRPYAGLLIFFILFISGVFVIRFNDIKSRSDWYGNYLNQTTHFRVVVKTNAEEKPKSYRITAQITGAIHNKEITPVVGNCLLYFAKDSNVLALKAGDELIVKNNLKTIENFNGQNGFDYKRHMALQGFYHQGYLKKDAWLFTGKNHSTLLDRTIHASLTYMHHLFETKMEGANEIALTKALLTGDRAKLNRSLVQAYANTGVVHIMAISGLHLGLIYIFLVRLTNVIPIVRKNNIMKLLVILSGIWFFAILTGCSPSVMRAAVMFSFLSLGILKKRKVTTYNFWAAAAFILLWFKPLLLFNVGFQLSFLAVLGILVVQRPIYKWFSFHSKITDYIWQLISVSMAAQLFTLPLCLYYFHQFPVLFIITNLIAIPLASIGLWMGVILIITSWIPYLSDVISFLLEKVFAAMNGFVLHMDSFSFSVWKGIFINKSETILISLIIIFLLSWLMWKSKLYFKYALVCVVGMAALSVFKKGELNFKSEELQSSAGNYSFSESENIHETPIPFHTHLFIDNK